MRKIRTHAPKSLLIAGVAAVALVGGACASDDGASPGQEAPAEDPFAPADETSTGGSDDYSTTGDESGSTTGFGDTGGEATTAG